MSWRGWSSSDVIKWMDEGGLALYRDIFMRADVTGEKLAELTPESLKAMGVSNLTQRANILKKIHQLTGLPLLVEANDGSVSPAQSPRVNSPAPAEVSRARTAAISSSPKTSAAASPTGASAGAPSPTSPVSKDLRSIKAVGRSSSFTDHSSSRTSGEVVIPEGRALSKNNSDMSLGGRRDSGRERGNRERAGTGNTEDGNTFVPNVNFRLLEGDMRGWLSKQSGTTFKRWNKRYFILKGRSLYYAKEEDAQTPIGCISVANARFSTGKRGTNTFALNGDQITVFKAASGDSFQRWVMALSTITLASVVDDDEISLPTSVLRMKAQGKLPDDVGEFVKEGMLKKSPASGKGKHHVRHFFLFTKRLIYAETSGKDHNIKGSIDLGTCLFQDVPEPRDAHLFSLQTRQGQRYDIQAGSSADKRDWVKKLTAIIDRLHAEKVSPGSANLLNPVIADLDNDETIGSDEEDVTVTSTSSTATTSAASTPPPGAKAGAAAPAATSPSAAATATASSPTAAGKKPAAAAPATGTAVIGTDVPVDDITHRQASRAMSLRSTLLLDKNFPKPPMPNCVRMGTYNIMHPAIEGDLFSTWNERKNLLATALRYHSCDMLGIQSISKPQFDELVTQMRDYSYADGVSEKDGAKPIEGAPFLPIGYFRWRLLVQDSGLVQLVPPEVTRPSPADYPWVVWVSFQDVFTEYSFVLFNTDLTAHCKTLADRHRNNRQLKATIAKYAKGAPFIVSLSGFYSESADPLDHDGLCRDEFEVADGKLTKLVDCSVEEVEPEHEHFGPKTTFATVENTNARVLDYIFGKRLAVETMQSGVTGDCFVNMRRASLHSLLIADLIIDVDAC